MKKKIITIACLAAIVGASAWQMNEKKNDVSLSDLALSNMEALAYIQKYCAMDKDYEHYCNYQDNVHPCPCGF